MTDNHPITPPPELVEQWRIAPEHITGREKVMFTSMTTNRLQEIATQASHWGADKQLVICLKWLKDHGYLHAASELKNHCRPKPPSLKEQALEQLKSLEVAFLVTHGGNAKTESIRRALEGLPD